MGKEKSLGEIVGKQLIESIQNSPSVKAFQSPMAQQLIKAFQSPSLQQLLRSVATITMGQSPLSETYNSEGIGLPFFQGKADFGKLFPSVRMYCNQPIKMAKANDILISVRAPVGAANIADRNCCIGRGLAAITTEPGTAHYKYVYYYLKYREKGIENLGVGSTFKAISKKDLDSLLIPLPPLSIQQKIADILDRASALIEKRKAQIEKLDLLVKSQFIEMFGDPVKNPMGWEVRKLKSLSHKITDGVHQKPNYVSDGVPFVSVVNITKGYVDFANCKYVSQLEYEKMTKSARPECGDVLYTKVGATYGIPAYIDTKLKFGLYVSVCLIKPMHESISAKFLAHSMGMPYVKKQADKRIKGIGVPDLHLDQIREFDILYPPIALQNKFASFVERVEAQKTQLKKSLALLEQNYRSLMQKCFRGEIF